MSHFSFLPLDDDGGDDDNDVDAPDHRGGVIARKGEVGQVVVSRPCSKMYRPMQPLSETEKFYGMKGK